MESHFIIISIAIPFITEVTTDSMTCTCKSREGGRGGPNPPWKIQINYITSPPPLQIKIYFWSSPGQAWMMYVRRELTMESLLQYRRMRVMTCLVGSSLQASPFVYTSCRWPSRNCTCCSLTSPMLWNFFLLKNIGKPLKVIFNTW